MSDTPFKDERKRRIGNDLTGDPAYPSKRPNTGDPVGASHNKDWSRTHNNKPTKSDAVASKKAEPGDSFSEADKVEEDPDGNIPGSGVLGYQKQAIWRQMLHYKRQHERAIDRVTHLEETRNSLRANLALANTYITKVFEALQHCVDRLQSHSAGAKDEEGLHKSELLRQLMEPCRQLDELDRTLQEKWVNTNKLLKELVICVHAVQGRDGNDDTGLSDNNEGQQKFDRLQGRCQQLSMQVSTLQGDLQSRIARVIELEKRLEDSTNGLSKLERKLDRLKLRGSSPLKEETQEMNKDVPLIKSEPDEESYAVKAEVRLAEIQKLQADRSQLTQDLENLRLSMANGTLTEEKIRESHLYRNLKEEYKHHVTENEILKGRLEKLTEELENLRSERRQYSEGVEAEEANRRKTLETEIRKLESDLTRIRGNRDHLQQSLELRCVKDEVELEQMQEIRVLANTRKDRIMCLKTEIQRLKMHAAAMAGDRALLLFFDENPDGNALEDLRQQLKNAQAKITELEDRRARHRDASHEESRHEQAMLSERRLQQQVDELQANVAKYERVLGLASADEQIVKQLFDRLKSKDEEITQLQLEIECYQKSESRLSAEIETLGKAWAELEEQNSRKVLNLAEKEDQFLRLMAERTKYEQKCVMLTKQNNASSNLGIALKRQSDKQLEQIRLMEQREKNLTQQLSNVEKELSKKTMSCEQQQRRAAEYVREINDLKEREQRSSTKYDNAVLSLRKQIDMFEPMAADRRKALEEAEGLRHKLNKIGKTEASSEAGLEKQLEEYKLLLKCSSCNNNFKSHVLNKCMHTFCKDCIDDMWTSRQRKCPTCGIGFAQQDIRQVYL